MNFLDDQQTAPLKQAGRPGDLVVLVHGMGRTGLSMLPLAWELKRAGYRVFNHTYSSFGPSVAAIGARLGDAVQERLETTGAARVHFVGHSLGNIVIRWLLAHRRPPSLGRVAMLAPPNRGARAADRLAPYCGWLLAPIRELKTTQSTVTNLPGRLEGVEFAVIAGSRDGKVSVEETRLPGASLHLVVRCGHTFIMMHPVVRSLVREFIARGEPSARTKGTELYLDPQ